MATATPPNAIDWLLEGDPAIRWQVEGDLLKVSGQAAATRKRVASEGWGAALLAEQAPDGLWGNGLYNPKWTSTFYTLLTLATLGLPPGNPRGARGSEVLLEKGIGPDGGIDYSRPRRAQSELCITGMGLRIMATFLEANARLAPIVRCLLETQLPDGGWNCHRDSAHGSFNTTISVLEGLAAWQAVAGPARDVTAALDRGREFFLVHRLFRSHTTGQVARVAFTRLSFPPHWHYDVLRGLDYFQSVDAPRDARFADAIELLLSKRRPDGRWFASTHPGREFFRMEPPREPSRWNTLRALRVLQWWEGD
jgi:hypothetical protein